MLPSIERKAELLLEKFISDPKLSRYVDKKRPIPKVFQGSGDIKLIILGQDPTVKDIASRDKIETVLNLDKSGNLRNYISKICTHLGLNLEENVYATNYLKNFFIKPPTQIQDIDVFKEFSPGWLHILVDELSHFPDVPVITLGEPLLGMVVNYGVSPKVRDYWGYTQNWKQGELGELKMLNPEQNSLNRMVFPFPHQPSLRKKFYRDYLHKYLDFVKVVQEREVKNKDYEKFEEECQRQYGRSLTEKEKEMIDNLRNRGFSDEHIMGLFND